MEPHEQSKTSLGLGLFIVREIVVGHGGTVIVQSSVDAGTAFTIRLPRAQERQYGRNDRAEEAVWQTAGCSPIQLTEAGSAEWISERGTLQTAAAGHHIPHLTIAVSVSGRHLEQRSAAANDRVHQ